ADRGRRRREDCRRGGRARTRLRVDRHGPADHRAAAGVVMFTGLVQELGTVASADRTGDGLHLSVEGAVAGDVSPGDSVAVDGVSLTVAEVGDDGFSVSLIPETLERTNLGAARAGDALNVEVDVLAKYVERLVPR